MEQILKMETYICYYSMLTTHRHMLASFIDNQNNLFMHFLATNYTGQVAMDGWNGQAVFF